MGVFTLKGARVNAGYTQKSAAAMLKISNKTLSNWEKGESVPNVHQVSALCELYGRKYDEINFLPCNPLKAENKEGA